ncbi:hypothetical protein HK099_005698 [Clydaea vesicula]|uniref:Uncharacterized protein n=1 Tax=Clydaea vesicula TaxID=447962 RepID=A0AAD5TZ44_9FUNG|nr:hypothetical protein HK099_005698 [Clydaea vesicula]
MVSAVPGTNQQQTNDQQANASFIAAPQNVAENPNHHMTRLTDSLTNEDTASNNSENFRNNFAEAAPPNYTEDTPLLIQHTDYSNRNLIYQNNLPQQYEIENGITKLSYRGPVRMYCPHCRLQVETRVGRKPYAKKMKFKA